GGDAAAEESDGSSDAGAPQAAPPVPPPPAVPPPAPAVAPVLVAAPVAPAPSPPPASPANVGPGDPEAKADFQHLWPSPEPSPTLRLRWGLAASVYGVERLDYITDSTQSFGVRASSDVIQRPATIRGSRGQQMLTPNNARFGLKLGNPDPTVVGAM